MFPLYHIPIGLEPHKRGISSVSRGFYVVASLIVHGGAGSMKGMNQRRLIEYRSALSGAAQAGGFELSHGGSALDAVIAAVRSMEDSGLFNAGLGAVLTLDKEAELDAADDRKKSGFWRGRLRDESREPS